MPTIILSIDIERGKLRAVLISSRIQIRDFWRVGFRTIFSRDSYPGFFGGGSKFWLFSGPVNLDPDPQM